jgi:hypothetical protein
VVEVDWAPFVECEGWFQSELVDRLGGSMMARDLCGVSLPTKG